MCAWPRDLLPIGRPTASSSFFPTADLFLCCGRRQLSCQRIACLARPPFASVDGLLRCLPPVWHGTSIDLGRPPPGGPRLQCSISVTASGRGGGAKRCCTVTMVVVTAALPRSTLLLPTNGSGLDPAHVHVSYWCSLPGTQELAIRRAVFVCPHALPNVDSDLARAFP